ncbi:MAG TPA: head GIN domain-containing protein [Flavobacterium sp.]|jgi:hypothetical protein
MIKIILTFTKIVVALIVTLVFASCGYNIDTIQGSGNIVSQNRDVTADFTSIEVDRGIEVVVEQGDKSSIVVETDDNLQQHITTEIRDGVLKISTDGRSVFATEELKVTVKLPIISGLATSAGASLSSRNVLRSSDLVVKASSGSEIKLSTEADKIICETSSGSTIDVSGKALIFETSSSSGSTIDAKDLLSNEVTAQSNSGSTIDVHPIVLLDAKASSGSSISYHSIPKQIKMDESSGGSISQQ